MAQPQPQRMEDQLQSQAQGQGQGQTEAIKYGHVFAVTGELAGQPIAPRDAAAMRSAEESVPGVPVPQDIGGGYSAGVAMETAAAYNQAVAAVRPGQASDAATNQGIAVTQTSVPGGRIITEFVAGQVHTNFRRLLSCNHTQVAIMFTTLMRRAYRWWGSTPSPTRRWSRTRPR